MKNAVIETAKEHGVDLPAATGSSSSIAPARQRPVCDYLSKDEASQLLGQPIAKTVVQDGACLYIGPPGLSSKLADETVREAKEKAQSGTARPEEMIGAIAQLTGAAKPVDGEIPLLNVMIDFDGGSQWTALTATKAIFGGIGDGKVSISQEIPNLGDHAMRINPMGLNTIKGNTLVRVIPGPLPGADERTIAVARTILSHL